MHTLVKIIISVAFSFTSTIIEPETKTYKISDTTNIKKPIESISDTITFNEKNICFFTN